MRPFCDFSLSVESESGLLIEMRKVVMIEVSILQNRMLQLPGNAIKTVLVATLSGIAHRGWDQIYSKKDLGEKTRRNLGPYILTYKTKKNQYFFEGKYYLLVEYAWALK